MYRYIVDNAVTYTSEDLVLFRESPFACWMERLTLENPDHGIPPDLHSQPPGDSMERQDELAETLRTEGKKVALVDWDDPEPERRRLTLDAMRRGEDFIVNGQLALGPLSGSSNLLMRTSGFSELGNYLYLPCDTQAKTTMHSAFRLCFLADLLHSLQGQLPGQMLIIRGSTDLVPLTTEDHIYHYTAVKQRFMQAMREFRKHKMPDPAESSHFGRWSECANEVMRQKAFHADDAQDESLEESAEEQALPEVLAVAAGAEAEPVEPEVNPQNPIEARLATSRGLEVNDTLASQAQSLQAPINPPPSLKPAPVQRTFVEPPSWDDASEEAAPEEDIEAAAIAPTIEAKPSPLDAAPLEATAEESVPRGRAFEARPSPELAEPARTDTPSRRAIDSALENLSFIGRQLSRGQDWRPEPAARSQPASPEPSSHPLDSDGFAAREEPVAPPPPKPAPTVDLDEVTPVLNTARPEPAWVAPQVDPKLPDAELKLPGADEELEEILLELPQELADEEPGVELDEIVLELPEDLVVEDPQPTPVHTVTETLPEAPEEGPQKVLHPSDLSDAELDEMEVDCIDDSDYRLPPGPPLVFDEPEKPEAPEPKKPEQKKKSRSFPFSSHLSRGGTDLD